MFPAPLTFPWIGPVGIRMVFMVLGVVVGVVVSIVCARRLEGLPAWRVALAQAAITVCGLFGGRLHFELNRGKHDTLASLLASASHLWWSHHAAGAVLGVIVGVALAASVLRLPLGKLADAIVPAAGLGYAIMRIGCVAHGCCTGAIAFCGWCIAWPRQSITFHEQVRAGLISEHSPHSALVHPLQFYFLAMGLGLSIVALAVHRRKAYDGEVALGALAWFAGWSAVLELARADYPGRAYLIGLPQLMVVAAGMFVVALAALVANRLRVRAVPMAAFGEAR